VVFNYVFLEYWLEQSQQANVILLCESVDATKLNRAVAWQNTATMTHATRPADNPFSCASVEASAVFPQRRTHAPNVKGKQNCNITARGERISARRQVQPTA
jgi:hypothetical protein